MIRHQVRSSCHEELFYKNRLIKGKSVCSTTIIVMKASHISLEVTRSRNVEHWLQLLNQIPLVHADVGSVEFLENIDALS